MLPIEERASHEAGHIIVARVLGYDTRSATISEEKGQSDIRCPIQYSAEKKHLTILKESYQITNGSVDPNLFLNHEAIAILEDQATITISGSNAEGKWCSSYRKMPFDDCKKYCALIRLLEQNGTDANELFSKYNLKSIRLIDDYWSQIERVAGLLIKNAGSIISSEQIEFVLVDL